MEETSYCALISSIKQEGEGFAISIPDGWMQGRTTYGGLSAALCLEAATHTFPDLPPLRSMQVAFVGPAGGDVSLSARLLRKGKSVTFVEAEIHGEKGLATKALMAFGDARPSQFDMHFMPPPDLPDPEGLEPYIPEGMGPAFAQHYQTAFVKGGRPVAGPKEHDHFLWVRHKHKEAIHTGALVALADMPPPAMMPMFDAFAPISSMTWMLNMLTDKPITDDGWWLLQTRAENAAQGYSSQDMLVWNKRREPVIAGCQSVAIFA